MIWKKLIALFLLLAVMASSFSGMLVVADYYANTGSYAKNCVNKLKPRLNCNGKCQLMKKIQEQEQKDQANTDSKIFLKSIIISSRTFYTPEFSIDYPVTKNHFIQFNTGREIDRPGAIFHPPGLC